MSSGSTLEGMLPTPPEPALHASAWQKRVSFWLPAADPTTLGFIRLCTGRWCCTSTSRTASIFSSSSAKPAGTHRFIDKERDGISVACVAAWEAGTRRKRFPPSC